MAFDVALGLQITEAQAMEYPGSKMIERLDWLLERQWGKTTQQVTATQLGVTRALALAFGKKGTKLPALATYEEVLTGKRKKATLPSWHADFEKANRGRAIPAATAQEGLNAAADD